MGDRERRVSARGEGEYGSRKSTALNPNITNIDGNSDGDLNLNTSLRPSKRQRTTDQRDNIIVIDSDVDTDDVDIMPAPPQSFMHALSRQKETKKAEKRVFSRICPYKSDRGVGQLSTLSMQKRALANPWWPEGGLASYLDGDPTTRASSQGSIALFVDGRGAQQQES